MRIMTKVCSTLIFLLFITTIFAQKVKGSRAVTISPREIAAFETIEVDNGFDIFLTYGDNCAIEIEADDNLHDLITTDLSGGNLRISTSQELSTYKKLSLKITYTSDLKIITCNDDSTITGLQDIVLADFTFKNSGSSKIYAVVRAPVFNMISSGKAKAELNLTSEKSNIQLSKNATLKALISSKQLVLDMYDKSSAEIEGDITNLTLRLDHNSKFTGKNLTAINATIVAEGYSSSSIHVTTKAKVEASSKSEIEFYGDPQFEIIKFSDSARLIKRPL